MGKEELINSLTYNNMPMENEAVDVTWQYVAPFALGLKNVAQRGLRQIANHPKTQQLMHAGQLLFHKPFEKMTNEEYASYGRLGKEYYKKYIQGTKAKNDIIGDVDFYGAQARKSDPRYMEQYPFLRKNIEKAKENVYLEVKEKLDKKGLPYTRKDATGFDNLKIKWKGKDYDYQIRNNPELPNKDFYNIKPYEKLLEELQKR